jgi:hypothetical protein
MIAVIELMNKLCMPHLMITGMRGDQDVCVNPVVL